MTAVEIYYRLYSVLKFNYTNNKISKDFKWMLWIYCSTDAQSQNSLIQHLKVWR
ncbi:hypothetical protein VCRA2128O98_130068 [Vibrio crassostreae]|nr:hypothetical protein VCRA2127O91_140068 [Vibrio crassostreae]CAK3719546.1 hypothetical protein VCRA2128O98_130068 [Vibrio crassostreae]